MLSVWHKCIKGVVIKTSGDCVSMCFEESLLLEFAFYFKVNALHLDLPYATLILFSPPLWTFNRRPNKL